MGFGGGKWGRENGKGYREGKERKGKEMKRMKGKGEGGMEIRARKFSSLALGRHPCLCLSVYSYTGLLMRAVPFTSNYLESVQVDSLRRELLREDTLAR